MITRLPLLTLLALATLAATARAQSTSPSDAATAVTPPTVGRQCVSVSSDYTGSPMLVIEYPWRRHAQPSVEVRMLGENEPDDYRIRPLHFRSDFMKGEMNVAVFQCQVEAETTRRVTKMTAGDIEFELIGDRNSLGKAAVGVCCDTPTPSDEFKTATRAAFGLLDAWAFDQRTLHLELPEGHFAEPGKMRVWLLRGDTIIWSEVTQWPGLGN